MAVIGIIIWLFITWVSSRGKFMFLHCVSENKAEVKVPWSKFGRHADNLFIFRIILGAICLAIIAIPVFMIAGFIITSTAIGMQSLSAVFGVAMIILYIFVAVIVFLLIRKFTTDFVVPIMFLRTTSCKAAWREFLSVLSNNKGPFALYILFQIAIAIGILAVVSVGFCIGICCCCIGVFLLIPYISTVVLLPIHVFMRSYSLYFFRQFGPQFDAFRPDIITVQAEPSQNIQ